MRLGNYLSLHGMRLGNYLGLHRMRLGNNYLGSPFSIRRFKEFELESDLLAEHLEEVDAETGTTLIQSVVRCCIRCPGRQQMHNTPASHGMQRKHREQVGR